MMSTLLESFPAILAEVPSVLVLITGPFMPADLRHDLEVRARGLPVKVKLSVNDSLSYMKAADLVVAMAGYNTTTEILSSGKKSILVPRAGPSAEQRTRARLFSERGWVDIIDPDELDPIILADRVIDSLNGKTKLIARSQPDLQGVSAAADNLCSLLPIEEECTFINVNIEEEPIHGLPF
jgi:predicted glycosyltransferase